MHRVVHHVIRIQDLLNYLFATGTNQENWLPGIIKFNYDGKANYKATENLQKNVLKINKLKQITGEFKSQISKKQI